jgi:hypothetical protein
MTVLKERPALAGVWGLILWALLATALTVAALEDEDPLWVGLPPAPGVLHLNPLPETEAEFAAELAAEAEAAETPPPSAALPPDDLFHQPQAADPDPDLFFQPLPQTPPRSAYPEILEEIFDPEAPAE